MFEIEKFNSKIKGSGFRVQGSGFAHGTARPLITFESLD